MNTLRLITTCLLFAYDVQTLVTDKTEGSYQNFVRLEDGHGVNINVYGTAKLSSDPKDDPDATSVGETDDVTFHIVNDLHSIDVSGKPVKRYWNVGTEEAPYWIVTEFRYV